MKLIQISKMTSKLPGRTCIESISFLPDQRYLNIFYLLLIYLLYFIIEIIHKHVRHLYGSELLYSEIFLMMIIYYIHHDYMGCFIKKALDSNFFKFLTPDYVTWCRNIIFRLVDIWAPTCYCSMLNFIELQNKSK